MDAPKIKILIVDDSPLIQKMFAHLFRMDPQLEVIGTAGDGQAALAFVQIRKPDVILMDIQMPVMNGYEATRRIMETDPVPIVICSASSQRDEVSQTFLAMEAGAVACVSKPVGPGHPEFAPMVAALIDTIKLMSEVKLVRRRRMPEGGAGGIPMTPASAASGSVPKIVAMGASTGGPLVLQTILTLLPTDYPLPILIVQHIATGFVQGLADWLRTTTKRPVEEARHDAPVMPGHVYLAPDNYHMGISLEGRIALNNGELENGLRPAVSYLFRSVSRVYGAAAVGVLLTGMGKDGAENLLEMKGRGAVTIAQDRESSLIHGMPGEAIRLGAARHVLTPEGISDMLMSLAGCHE